MRALTDILFYCAVVTVVSLIAWAAIPARAATQPLYTPVNYDNCGPGGATRVYSNQNLLWPGVDFFPLSFTDDSCLSYTTPANCSFDAMTRDCEYKRGLCSEWRKHAHKFEGSDKRKLDATIKQNCRGL